MHGFSTGRRPKPKIVKTSVENEDGDIEDVTSGTESMEIESPTIPAIKRLNRPTLPKKSSGSKLKLSFGGDDEVCLPMSRFNIQDAGDEETFVPKRSALSKKVTESKGRKFGLQVYISTLFQTNMSAALPTTPSETLPSRPTYTKEYLTQLRDSTPSTPRDLSRYLSDDSESANSVPITTARPAEILDEAVIRALKERRRERARGEDYLSLNPDDDLKPLRRRDSDEDDYETFVNDPVRLQKNMEAAQQKHKKSEIQEALYYSDSEAMSDVDSNEWENQQIAKAQPTLVKAVKRDPYAMPSEIPVVTTYTAAMTRLRGQLDAMKARQKELLEMVGQLDKESEEIREREEAVQESLTKAGKEYDLLREEFKATGANRGLDEVGEFGLQT
jgi:Nineteen complex-related protein 2